VFHAEQYRLMDRDDQTGLQRRIPMAKSAGKKTYTGSIPSPNKRAYFVMKTIPVVTYAPNCTTLAAKISALSLPAIRAQRPKRI
jgi:hypothetical protein